MPPDLTPYQIHELIMEAIGIDTPDRMPARVIVESKWSERTGIPTGQYSPAGPDAMWIRTGDLPAPKEKSEPEKEELTTYQIHERIMETINCHTLPNFTPSRLIFRSDRAFLCDIPRGIYVLGPEGVWLNTGQALSAEPGEGGPDIYQISDILSEHISWTYCGEAVPDKANVTSEYAEMLGIPEGIYIPGGTNGMWVWAGDLPKEEKYCCDMRRHYVLGIVGTRGDAPTEMVDFAIAWEPKIIVAPVFCCWCGEKYREKSPRTVTGM